MGDISKWCPICGAKPGSPCKVISGDPAAGEKPGDVRADVHFYRNNDMPISALIPDEPDWDFAATPSPAEGEGKVVKRTVEGLPPEVRERWR